MTGQIRRFLALDSWRGIAALGVAITHFPIIAVSHVNDHKIVQSFALFVDFFFVLSGFVITFAYWERLKNWTELRVFALRRFARLWPLNAAILVPLVLLNLVWWMVGHPAFRFPNTWQTLVANLLLVQGLIFPKYTWNGQTWSISVEFWTYFLFAALCLSVPRRVFTAATIAVVTLAGIAMLVFSLRFSQPMMGQLLVRCIYGFFAGQCLYFLWRAFPFRLRGGPALAAEIGAVLAVIMLLAFLPADGPLFLAQPLVYGALIWIFAAEAGGISKMLMQPFPRLLGQTSYSIYMTHMLVLAWMGTPLRHWGHNLAQNKWAADALLVLFLILTVALSRLTFIWIEKPGTRLFGPRLTPHLPG